MQSGDADVYIWYPNRLRYAAKSNTPQLVGHVLPPNDVMVHFLSITTAASSVVRAATIPFVWLPVVA